MARTQLPDQGAGLAQRQRQRPDRILALGREGDTALNPCPDFLDAGLGGGDPLGELIVTGSQQVAAPRLAL